MQPNLFNVLYVTGAAGTVGYLLFLTSRGLPGWLWAHRLRSVGDWLLAPFEALLGVFVTMVVFTLTVIGWPAVLPVVLLVEKRH